MGRGGGRFGAPAQRRRARCSLARRWQRSHCCPKLRLLCEDLPSSRRPFDGVRSRWGRVKSYQGGGEGGLVQQGRGRGGGGGRTWPFGTSASQQRSTSPYYRRHARAQPAGSGRASGHGHGARCNTVDAPASGRLLAGGATSVPSLSFLHHIHLSAAKMALRLRAQGARSHRTKTGSTLPIGAGRRRGCCFGRPRGREIGAASGSSGRERTGVAHRRAPHAPAPPAAAPAAAATSRGRRTAVRVCAAKQLNNRNVTVKKGAAPAEADAGGEQRNVPVAVGREATALWPAAGASRQKSHRRSHPPPAARAAAADVGTVGLAAIALGLPASVLTLVSEYTLFTTGSGLPPGPGGALGAAEVRARGARLASSVSLGVACPELGLSLGPKPHPRPPSPPPPPRA
jgi:hypothetical protein